MNFPVTPVPTQAAAFIAASGLVRTPGDPYYHSAFGAPFQLHMVVRRERPVGGGGRPGDPGGARGGGPGHDAAPRRRRDRDAGEVLAAGFADLALLPVTFTPYMSQTIAWYTTLLGPAGKNGSQDWTGYSSSQFDQLVETASQQLNPNTAAGYYAQADTSCGTTWSRCRSSPNRRPWSWSRTIGGVTPMPRSDSLLWFAQLWAVRVPESTSNTTPSLPGQ